MSAIRTIAKMAAILLLLATTTFAQFWQKKDPSQWTREECWRLLGESPWQAKWGVGNSLEGDPSLEYVAFIASAWPLQKAWATVKDSYYTKLKVPDSRSTLGQQVHLDIDIHYSATQSLRLKLSEYWKSWSDDELLDKIVLVTDGKRVRPLEVTVNTAEEAYWGFIVGGWLKAKFPRDVDGKSILNPGMKKVYVEILDPNGKVRLPFNVKKMIVRGELVY